MELTRLLCILAVVVGFVLHLKVDPKLGRMIMLFGAFGLLGIFGARSLGVLKARHTVPPAAPPAPAADVPPSSGEPPRA